MTESDVIRHIAAGHAVIFEDGMLAFHADDCEHAPGDNGLCGNIRHLRLPPMLVPLLTKILSGAEIETSDIPATGPFGMLARKMGARNGG